MTTISNLKKQAKGSNIVYVKRQEYDKLSKIDKGCLVLISSVGDILKLSLKNNDQRKERKEDSKEDRIKNDLRKQRSGKLQRKQ